MYQIDNLFASVFLILFNSLTYEPVFSSKFCKCHHCSSRVQELFSTLINYELIKSYQNCQFPHKDFICLNFVKNAIFQEVSLLSDSMLQNALLNDRLISSNTREVVKNDYDTYMHFHFKNFQNSELSFLVLSL